MTKPKIDLGLGDLDAFEPTERGGGRAAPVPAAERQAIDATAREHGFTKTSIPTVLPRRAKRAANEPMHQLNIRGPVSVIARFIAYCDDERLAYWEALDRLMKSDGR